MSMVPHRDNVDRLEGIIAAWLHAKYERSHSEQTLAIYEHTIRDFRGWLQEYGMDLDADEHLPALDMTPNAAAADQEARARRVSFRVQQWAAHVEREGKTGIAASTYNRRLAVLSSFYSYAIKMGVLTVHPIRPVDRRTVNDYESAAPMESENLRRRLASIDTRTALGTRDLALLLLAFTTGRRAMELANLSTGDLANLDTAPLVVWEHTKGGKKIYDQVERIVSQMIVNHLLRQYGPLWEELPSDTPVWTSLSTHGRGERLSYWGIRAIYKGRLGVSKVHTSRHSFAHMMLNENASLKLLQEKLGHSSIAITDRYIRRMPQPVNAHAPAILRSLGFGEEE